MFADAAGGGCGETAFRQDEAVTRLSHRKMLRRVREMNRLASSERSGPSMSLDDILREITAAKMQHRTFLLEIKRARALQTRDLARQARLSDHKPFPHPRPWSDSPLLDPERERMTPEAIAGDALLEFQEIKRARREGAEKHPSWKYPNVDRAFGEPPLYCCTSSFKRVLEGHLEQAVARITKSYEMMDEGTLRLSNLKADVGAELWLMQSALDEVRRGLAAAKEEERLKILARGKRRHKRDVPRSSTSEDDRGEENVADVSRGVDTTR